MAGLIAALRRAGRRVAGGGGGALRGRGGEGPHGGGAGGGPTRPTAAATSPQSLQLCHAVRAPSGTAVSAMRLIEQQTPQIT